jgi:hypothetical protein
MAAHAMFDNSLSVSRNLLRTGCIYYAIVDSSKSKLWDNFEDDDTTAEDASERIKQDLELIRKGNTAIYTILHWRNKPKDWKKTEPDYTSTFKQGYEEQKQEYRGFVSGQNDQILNELRELHRRLDSIEISHESEPDEYIEDQSEPKYMGALNNPVVQQILLGLAGNLFKPNTPPAAPAGLAGIESNIEVILKTLYSKGVTIDDLQKLSEMPADKISFLLSMLRGNG